MGTTRFMQRLYSAQANGEDLILDQVQDDVESTLEGSPVDTEQYRMTKVDDGTVQVDDKVNNESTDIRAVDGGLEVEPSANRGFSSSTDRSLVIDRDGNIVAIGARQSLGRYVQENPGYRLVGYYKYHRDRAQAQAPKLFSRGGGSQRSFTRSNYQYVVLNSRGKFMALQDLPNARGLVEKNPGWTMVRKRDYIQGGQEGLTPFKGVLFTRN